MAEFLYEALDKQGKQVKGLIEAANEDLIIEKLKDMGYYPLKVTAHKKKAGDMDLLAMPGLRLIFHRVKQKHITTFTRQLATLVDAGLPIIRSLTILREQVESVLFRDIIQEMSDDIESGLTLSDAFGRHPKVFDHLYVNMVRAGEIGGVLEVVLNKLAIFMEKQAALISKVKSAMMYPIVVICLAGVIVSFILIKIIPRFVAIFEELGAELPLPTQILVAASDILVHKTWMPILGIGVAVFLIKKINRTKPGRLLFDRLKLKMPMFGPLFQKSAIARFAGTLSTLITAGVPILQALDIVRDSAGNEVVSLAMAEVYQSVKEGDTIHEPLSKCPVFPPLVYHMVAVGEETGAIDHMLTKVAEAYEREVQDMVDGLTALMEPLLIVGLGILIGGIVIALYLPLFELPQHVGK